MVQRKLQYGTESPEESHVYYLSFPRLQGGITAARPHFIERTAPTSLPAVSQ